jgi:hypothetical protein
VFDTDAQKKAGSEFGKNEALSYRFDSDVFCIVTSFTVINAVFSLTECSLRNIIIP